MTANKAIVNLNGIRHDPEAPGLSVDDGGFKFGDTLFETMKARDGRIPFLDLHLERLERSARLLDFPYPGEKLTPALDEVLDELDGSAARIRMTLSRGAGGIEPPSESHALFVIRAGSIQEPEDEDRVKGVVCMLAPNRRVNPRSHLPQIKSGNYGDCLFAARHARRHGADEALFVTDEGQLLEGATTNLFLAREGLLLTPPLGNLVLDGIMRGRVLDAAKRLGIPAAEGAISLEDLDEAEEMFLTNSLVDVMPVAEVDGRRINRGPLAERLRLEMLRAATM